MHIGMEVPLRDGVHVCKVRCEGGEGCLTGQDKKLNVYLKSHGTVEDL